MVRIFESRQCGGHNQVTEEIMVTTFQRVRSIPVSIRNDHFSGFKGKAMKKVCRENNNEQKFCPAGDHRG